MCWEQENRVRQSFTPQVQDSDGPSDSKHFDEESRDYLLSYSRENQSEDDSESTDDGFDRFTDHQVHLSISVIHVSGYVCHAWHLFFFLLLIEIISIKKLLIIAHFFVLKHEKQTLSYIHTKFEGDKNKFFSSIYFVEVPVFLPQHWKLLGPERLMPLKLLGMNRVKQPTTFSLPCGLERRSRSLTLILQCEVH